MINIHGVLGRLLDVLREHPMLADDVAEFRIGQLGTDPAGARDSPSIYVTPESNSYTNADRTGTRVAGYDVQSTIKLRVAIIAGSIDSKAVGTLPGDVTDDLYRIGGAVVDALRANPRLKKADGTEPLLVRSSVMNLNEELKYRGGMKQMATVQLQGQVGEQWTAEIPDADPPLSISLLSKPAETTARASDVIRLAHGSRAMPAMEEHGTIGLEYENEPEVSRRVQEVVDGGRPVQVLLKSAGAADRTYLGRGLSQQATAAYDDIDRMVAIFELIR